jgi:hypothetical protein
MQQNYTKERLEKALTSSGGLDYVYNLQGSIMSIESE